MKRVPWFLTLCGAAALAFAFAAARAADESKDPARDAAKAESKETAAAPKAEVNGLPLVFHEDFKDGDKALDKFDLLDPTDWKMARDDGRPVLSLATKPTDKSAKTPVRSPFGRALVKDLYVGPFVMEVRLKSTVKDYPHRDMCLFWGVVDDAHEYYVHFGKKPDPHCGNIFIVNNADRLALLPVPAQGIDWTDHAHTARVERGADGSVEVFFDGKSWLKAKDATFPVGRVGVGSFDDTGDFAEVTVWGKKADKPAAPADKPAAKPAAKAADGAGKAAAKDGTKDAGETK